jgi:hypothetical protein
MRWQCITKLCRIHELVVALWAEVEVFKNDFLLLAASWNIKYLSCYKPALELRESYIFWKLNLVVTLWRFCWRLYYCWNSAYTTLFTNMEGPRNITTHLLILKITYQVQWLCNTFNLPMLSIQVMSYKCL